MTTNRPLMWIAAAIAMTAVGCEASSPDNAAEPAPAPCVAGDGVLIDTELLTGTPWFHLTAGAGSVMQERTLPLQTAVAPGDWDIVMTATDPGNEMPDTSQEQVTITLADATSAANADLAPGEVGPIQLPMGTITTTAAATEVTFTHVGESSYSTGPTDSIYISSIELTCVGDVMPPTADCAGLPSAEESQCIIDDVAALADDALLGRQNGSPGAEAARDHIRAALESSVVVAGGSIIEQSFPDGINVLAVIPGSELPDEYVLVGAHYDHIGTNCFSSDPTDDICNGATDNAAGVAAVLSIGRSIAADPTPPRRSVVLALWDREEDGLLGSLHYINNPIVPLADTVAYVNFDIVGSNLLPSLANSTFAVAAETGGTALSGIVDQAVADQTGSDPLSVGSFSSIFGQFRSDYASLLARQVPSVFFTDSTGPCYHTAQDDLSVVDFGKLERQISVAEAVTRSLITTTSPPTFDPNAAQVSFRDAEVMAAVLQAGLTDLARFSPAAQNTLLTFESQVAGWVADGAGSFSAADGNSLLGGSASVISILSSGECDGFLD